MIKKSDKLIVYAEGLFASDSAKTALGVIRYGEAEVVCVVDSVNAGKVVSDIYPSLPSIPIFSSIDEAKNNIPLANILLIGIAPAGGIFPPEWFKDIKKAISLKLNIVNGLHDFLLSVPELRNLAVENDVYIWDVRNWNKQNLVAKAKLLNYPNNIVLTVGTDASIGKMTTSLELLKSARKKKLSSDFFATGQTGMMISGNGIPVDALIIDFAQGEVEQGIINLIQDDQSKIVFVEGQGAIFHPAWSSVTLSLLHGALPQKMILCHNPLRKSYKGMDHHIESVQENIYAYESISHPLRKSKVVGVSLNTFGMDNVRAQNEIQKLEDALNLPVEDPVRSGADKLLEFCL